MATTNENHSMNLISMETQSTPFNPGNNPVLMLVAGLACMIAGIVKLVQCGRQNQEENSENATIHGYEIARRAMIGLSFATAGLSLIWKAYQLELVQHLSILFHVLVIIFGLILIGYIQENGLQPSLNTQSCNRGLLGVQDFCFWAVLAAGPMHKKKVLGRL